MEDPRLKELQLTPPEVADANARLSILVEELTENERLYIKTLNSVMDKSMDEIIKVGMASGLVLIPSDAQKFRFPNLSSALMISYASRIIKAAVNADKEIRRNTN